MTNYTTQEERLDYLVEEFKADSDEYKDLKTPDNDDEKRRQGTIPCLLFLIIQDIIDQSFYHCRSGSFLFL